MKGHLRACFSLFRIRAAEGLQYRAAALSGAAVSAFWALIEAIILTVFFTHGRGGGGTVNGLSLEQGVSYIWIGQLLVMLQMPGIDGELMGKITGGDIGTELCRPLDLYWHWFARAAAGKVNAFLLRGGAVVLCGAVIRGALGSGLGLSAPASPLNFALFLAGVLGAFLFSAAFGMFLTSIRMGIAWGNGPINLIIVSSMVLSGGYLPLQLWPDFLQDFLRLQPFAASLDTPARLYTGSISPGDGAFSLLLQLLWIAAFIAAGRAVMAKKLKTIVIQGG